MVPPPVMKTRSISFSMSEIAFRQAVVIKLDCQCKTHEEIGSFYDS